MKDNLKTKVSEEAETPAFFVGAVMCRAGEDIGIKDANGNDIFVGSVIEHNNNLYLIKWSDNRKSFVARSEPLNGKKASWRDISWVENLAKRNYIKMIGTILFDEDMRKRFNGVYR